jgi:cytochrome c556
MLRKWANIVAIAGSVVLVLAGAAVQVSPGGDDEDKPLKKLMKKIDADTKSIRDATTSVTKFKKAGNGKDLAKLANEIARLGKETREFKEPSEKMKKPFDKWLDMNDRFVVAAGELEQVAGKGDLVGARKAWSALNNTCTNCHGAFRPEVGDGF